MSDNSKGIFHVVGIAFTVITTLAGVLSQCQPKADKQAARNALLLKTPPKSAILRPQYWPGLLDPDWSDSIPFDLRAVADAGMRYITAEEYNLPTGEDTLRQALEWGMDRGERSRLTQYTLDMRRPVLKSLRVKEFRGIEVKPPRTVVWSGFYEFTYALDATWTEVDIREEGDGVKRDEVGTWRIVSGNQRQMDFAQSKDWRYRRDDDLEIGLVEQDGEWRLMCFVADSVARLDRIRAGAEGLLRGLVTEDPGARGFQAIEVVQGNPLRPARRMLLDSLWKPSRGLQYAYDPMGRPDTTQLLKRGGSSEEIVEVKKYGPHGLEGATEYHQGILHKLKVGYENGWPNRVVYWSEMPNGRVQVLSRIFIRYQSL